MPLIHQWKFNGNLEDSIGGLNFTNTRNLATFTTGVVQQSLNFANGNHAPQNSGIYTSSNPLPSTQDGPWTISFWIKNVEEDVFLYLFGDQKSKLYFSRSSSQNTFTLGFDNNDYYGEAIVKLGTNSTKTEFTNYVIIYSGKNVPPVLYINGVEEEIDFSQNFSTENIVAPTYKFFISNTQYGYQLEDLRIYDEAITSAEVSNIYNSVCSEITTEYKLVITTQPTGTYTNVSLSQIVVEIQDINDNVVTNSNLQVTAEIYSGTGNVAGITSVQAINGIATFNNLRIDTAGTFTLAFTNPCLVQDVSDSVSVQDFLGTLNVGLPNMALFLKCINESNINLHTLGFGKKFDLATLFLKANTQESLNLHTFSLGTQNKNAPLFLKALTFEQKNLYTKAHVRSVDFIRLFLSSNINNNLTLHMNSNSKRLDFRRLFLKSDNDKGIKLFTKSIPEKSLNLFLKSNLQNNINFYLQNSPQGILNLFINVFTPSLSNIGSILFMQGDDPVRLFYKGVNLFTRSYIYEGMNLYMEVPTIGSFEKHVTLYTKSLDTKFDINNNLNLTLFNNIDGSSSNMSIYVKGKGISQGYLPFDSSMNLYMSRDIEHTANSLNLFLTSKELFNNYINSFTKGHIISNNYADLSIPVVNGIINKNLDFYVNGYNPWEESINILKMFIKVDEV